MSDPEDQGEDPHFDSAADGFGDELIGTTIADRYFVRRRIGEGGMGVVFEAEHVQLKKRVAVKILHERMSHNPQVAARFEREAVAAGRIRHPSVVTATDFGRLGDDTFYMVLEYVDGRGLSEVLDEVGRLPPERAFRIAYQMSSALAAAHGEGIIHRDLKPENVMLISVADGEDYVKVLDFGIAKMKADELPEGQERLTQIGLVFGTPAYMSPEQARGESVDHRTDLYALGMIFYEMLAGHPAFDGGEMMAILTAQMADPPPPLPEDIPKPVADIVYELLQKRPDDRPPSADNLTERLAEVALELNWPLPNPRTSARYDPLRRSSVDIRIGRSPGALESIRSVSMRPVAVGSKKVPLWVPVGALLAGITIGGFAAVRGTKELRQETLLAATDQNAAEEQLLVEARAGDRDALAELRKLVEVEERSVAAAKGAAGRGPEDGEQAARYLALGRGYSVIRHYSAALEAYERAVRLDPHLAEDPDLLVDVRVAIEQRDSVEQGLELALQHLGAHGSDLIYDVWRDHLGQPGMTPIVARAQRLVRGGDLTKQATPALQMAIALDAAKVCAEYRKLLPRAVEVADQRSLATLEALQQTRGCGADAKRDCFPCLRGADVPLDAAVEAAHSRPAPEFLEDGALRESHGTPQ